MKDLIICRPDQFGVRLVTWTMAGKPCAAAATTILEAWRIFVALRCGDYSVLRY